MVHFTIMLQRNCKAYYLLPEGKLALDQPGMWVVKMPLKEGLEPLVRSMWNGTVQSFQGDTGLLRISDKIHECEHIVRIVPNWLTEVPALFFCRFLFRSVDCAYDGLMKYPIRWPVWSTVPLAH